MTSNTGPDETGLQNLWGNLRKKHGDQSGSGLTDNSAQQQNQNQPSGGLFGNTQSNQQQDGGLFGNSTQQSQAAPSGGLFGTANAQNQNQNQNAGTGGLFGGNNTQQNTTQGTGGLFGSTNNQQSNTGGLFGNTNSANNQQNTGGLFGNTNNQQSNQQSNSGGFGGSSIFGGAGGLGGNQPTNSAQNMFAKPSAPASSSIFGLGSSRPPSQMPQPSVPSMLGATQHAQMNNSAPFGRLSMGQSNAGTTTSVGAAKIDLDTLRLTTRFEDCIDPIKSELEQLDKLIQQQENFCKQIEAFLPQHEIDIESLNPDIDYIKNKVEDAEQALVHDAVAVDNQRQHTARDRTDLERCERIMANLQLPAPYQYGNMGSLSSLYGSQQRPQQAPSSSDADDHSYDTDLIGNYFVPMTAQLQRMMNSYTNNLTEIENHMRVIESSAISQAQQLAQRKAGGNSGIGQPTSEDTVRELADTLRGFEQGILNVAGTVGECREGLNELVLGRLGTNMGSRY